MGGDGQALINKRSLLESHNIYNTVSTQSSSKQHEKQQQITHNKENLMQKWTHCALSLEPLEAPIVFDLAGNLYGKRALQEHIDEISQFESIETTNVGDQEQIYVPSKLSDVCEISADSLTSSGDIKCAMTNVINRNGVHSFIGFWKCGHVVLQSTLSTSQTVKSKESFESECPFCGEESIYVKLVISDAKAAALQQKKLYRRLRKTRKRSRSEKEQEWEEE